MSLDLFITAGGLIAAGLIAFGVIREKTVKNARSIDQLWDNKQGTRTCAVQHRAIMRELDAINKKLNNLGDKR